MFVFLFFNLKLCAHINLSVDALVVAVLAVQPLRQGLDASWSLGLLLLLLLLLLLVLLLLLLGVVLLSSQLNLLLLRSLPSLLLDEQKSCVNSTGWLVICGWFQSLQQLPWGGQTVARGG